MHPDRVVIGTADAQAVELILKDLYSPLAADETSDRDHRRGDRRAHQVRRERLPRHQDLVHQRVREPLRARGRRRAGGGARIGLDRRIGPKFLHAGPGFGGSCFPKDTRAVAHFARQARLQLEMVEAVIRVNQRSSASA